MMEEPTMGLFDRGYDRDHDRRPRSRDLNYDTWRYRAGNRGDNEFGGTGYNSRNYFNTTTRPYSDYDGAYRSMRGGYDRDMRSVGIGYDEQYKSRAQTDYGDPFNDRESHTPIRVMRGEARGYDRDVDGRLRPGLLEPRRQRALRARLLVQPGQLRPGLRRQPPRHEPLRRLLLRQQPGLRPRLVLAVSG
jgi:hypothetical protein